MRQPRLKAPPELPVAYYHCVSRVVNREFVLGDAEKEQFRRYLRLYEGFCGVRVVTYCVMSNHFHILLEVPRRPEVLPNDEELLARLKRTYSGLGFATIRQNLELLRAAGATAEAEAYRETFFARMWHVSAFMKGLKQRFTQWFNRRHARKGTLWEERFRSVLVEGAGEALAAMAAYIDLNPVRAAMVSDPKDYRWCGYAEAVGGNRQAVAGLKIVTDTDRGLPARAGGGVVLGEYRDLLYGRGEERGDDGPGRAVRKGFSRERVDEVLAKKGKLTWGEMLHCRVRYFADGAVLGSKEFVNAVFAAERHRFGPKRQTGARPLRGVDAGSLCTLRDLRVAVVR
ncbi:MAG: transposase [Chthoniobacteraceae bacterium]